MSLKHFHLAFIFFCAFFSLGFAAWCLLVPGLPKMFFAMGCISALGGVVLVYYGVRFVRKTRKLVT